MKIPKLFKKAAAFVMAAVTALSIMPATAFAAGDIGTISFSHTYDSNGNAMRYNSSANIGGYTAGGTGNYKYRMFVDGENAFCIQPGVPLKTGNTLKKASSDTWNALSANQKKAVGLALLYGYQGNRNNLSGSDDEKWLATQTLVWEFVTGCREATGSYNQTSTTVYSLHFGSNYANSGARAVYDQIVAMLREHNTIPYFSYYSDRVEERIINLSHTEVDRDFSKYNTVENIQWCIQNLNMKGIEDYEFDVLGYHSDAIDLRIHTDLLVKMIVPDAIDTIFTDQIIDLEKLVWITDVSDMRVFAQDI